MNITNTGPLRPKNRTWQITITFQTPPGRFGVIYHDIADVIEKHASVMDEYEIQATRLPREDQDGH